ncbi:MAG: hypothetical protein ACYDA5_04525 [Vulcanimicrobiaceae bacterium]
MPVGETLLDLARRDGVRSVFVVGIAKNVGKTVTLRALLEAAYRVGLGVAVASTGRDGEQVDVSDAQPKPRLFLRPGTILATARALLPASPACEVLDLSREQTAAGTLLFVRARRSAYYELLGPPTASGMRRCIERFRELGAEQVLVDGSVDRIAAVCGGNDAIIVAAGAAAAPTQEEALAQIGALVARLRTPAYDASAPALHHAGALTAAGAGVYLQARERRQIVVRDPTQIALSGKAFCNVAARLDLRCERPLRVVAATVASIGRDRSFEPGAFLRAVAAATGLPTFDIYADASTAA